MEITVFLRVLVPRGASARACGVCYGARWVRCKWLFASLLRFFARFFALRRTAFWRLLCAAKIVIILDNAKRFGVLLRAFLYI